LLNSVRKILDQLRNDEETATGIWTNEYAKQIPILEKNCKAVSKLMQDECYGDKNAKVDTIIENLLKIEENVVE